jgi:glycosyltransferase involved in cell wall biosynthesis
MPERELKIAYLTAGAAGMYCGSCMHDNTLAAALTRSGVDIQLLPVYTPIRTDEGNVSVDRVFFGGVNVYLQERFRLFRHLPPALDRILDQPRLLRWATSRATAVDPRFLGALTVSMLRGEHGHQRKEVRRLCRYLASAVRPNLVVLTNILIGGCIPYLKQTTQARVLVTLQGDDVFLDFLPEPHRADAIREIRRLVDHVDGFLVHSRYYANHMNQYLGIPAEKIHVVPLGIDCRDFAEFYRLRQQVPAGDAPPHDNTRPPTIGYLARVAPEKGFHLLVDSFLQLRRRPGLQHARLRVAGWLGEHHRQYAEAEFAKLRAAVDQDAFQYLGEVDRGGKIEFLRQLDVLSVPTTYRDPKGLFVLEALAAGVPVVQPDHGAFPELIQATGGGCLTAPDDAEQLAVTLQALLTDHPRRRQYADAGLTAVHERHNADTMAQATLKILRQYAV